MYLVRKPEKNQRFQFQPSNTTQTQHYKFSGIVVCFMIAAKAKQSRCRRRHSDYFNKRRIDDNNFLHM